MGGRDVKGLGTFLVYVFLAAASAPGQNITMKDGKIIVTKGVRRRGDIIMATVDLPAVQPGQAAAAGELGYPLAQIAKIDFPEPAQLKASVDLITVGKAAAALAGLEPVLRYYETFRDAPGSWWAEASLLKMEALASLGREEEAEDVAANLAHSATDPETMRAANTYLAAGLARRGDVAKAQDIYNAILREATRPQTIAKASVDQGQIHLVRKEWEGALLCFLQVPVFYPEEKVLMPRVLLGCGRAYAGMKDFARARAALEDLTTRFGATPEAGKGRAELATLTKLEKANQSPQ